jgi:hypothetical protein
MCSPSLEIMQIFPEKFPSKPINFIAFHEDTRLSSDKNDHYYIEYI